MSKKDFVYEIYFRKKGNKRWLKSGRKYTGKAKAIAEAHWLDKDKRSHYEHAIKKIK